MDTDIRQRLLHATDHGLHRPDGSICKICGQAATLFDVVDFNKLCNPQNIYEFGLAGIVVRYDRCTNCGFLFTGFCDSWSSDDFAQFIYNDEYIKVDGDYVDRRPRADAGRMAEMLADWRRLSILDFGGGAGIFARTLGEHGFNARTYDPFASPERPSATFDLITCFEVLEHSPDPVGTIRDIASFLSDDGIVIFSTGIQPVDINQIRANWWYVAPRNGHISIYTFRALMAAGAAAGLLLHIGHGGTGWSRVGSTESARRLQSLIGEPSLEILLGAPAGEGEGEGEGVVQAAGDCWHGLEQAQAPFRWTSRADIDWAVRLPFAGTWQLRFAIPWLIEIEPGFAAGAALRIGDNAVPLVHEDGALRASITAEFPDRMAVRLTTPPPRSPFELRGLDDHRPLGLAIAVGS